MARDQGMRTGILKILNHWVEARRQHLSTMDIKISLTRGPADRTPEAAWVDFESATKLARLTIWADGQAEFTVLDIEGRRALLDEHREITDVTGLDDVESAVVAWFD